MREIKFRVWDPNNDYMHQNINAMRINLFDYSGDNITEQDGLHIMQYTGLKDKKGKEIYEGDVIDVKDDGFPFVKDWIGIVKFIEGSYLIENLEGTDGEYLFDELREIEVIGNIYENTDLLELALAPPSDSINLA